MENEVRKMIKEKCNLYQEIKVRKMNKKVNLVKIQLFYVPFYI